MKLLRLLVTIFGCSLAVADNIKVVSRDGRRIGTVSRHASHTKPSNPNLLHSPAALASSLQDEALSSSKGGGQPAGSPSDSSLARMLFLLSSAMSVCATCSWECSASHCIAWFQVNGPPKVVTNKARGGRAVLPWVYLTHGTELWLSNLASQSSTGRIANQVAVKTLLFLSVKTQNASRWLTWYQKVWPAGTREIEFRLDNGQFDV